jgi:exopolyphosphatase / guanosine-5'-triphosphate,3'-diphosphate pyrophosphatase
VSSRPRAGAIDIGTNSVLLTIAERAGGELATLLERATITRLGAGVDRERRLSPDAVERTFSCLVDYHRELRALGVDRIEIVGTSALRDAGGGPELGARVAELFGRPPRVVSGREEAELTFEGATIGLDLEGELFVFDIGGGSTEIICGMRSGVRATVQAAESLDVGSVRLFERHVRSDPPASAELGAIDREVEQVLRGAPRPAPCALLVGVAGTVTTLAALDQSLREYDAQRVHGSRLSRQSVERLAAELAAETLAARRQRPGLEPGRADVIVVGARLVLGVLDWAGARELLVSDRGVRWGLIQRALSPEAGGSR